MKWNIPPQMGKLLEQLGRYRYVILMMAVGVILLALPNGEGEKTAVSAVEASGYSVEELEGRIEKNLSKIVGAGETSVVLTLADEGRTIVAQDIEQGSVARSDVVTVTDENRGEEVVPLQVIAPSFRGALVVSEGAGDPVVALALIRAVSVLTGLGSDRIAVCAGG